MRVEYTGITVSLDGTYAVRDAALDAPAGAFVGIVGPNGSGKSTLLRCLFRALNPTAGVVTVGGRDVRAVSARENARQVAALTQDSVRDNGFSAWEVVRTGRLPHRGAGRHTDRAACAAALTAAGAIHLRERDFGSLSGGEAQRVLIARALAQEPKVLVLDEPTNHLDVRHQYAILGAARRLGITVLAALHDLNLAAQFCDRIVVLSAGRVMCQGTPTDVLTAESIAEWFGVGAHVIAHPRLGTPQILFDPLDGIH